MAPGGDRCGEKISCLAEPPHCLRFRLAGIYSGAWARLRNWQSGEASGLSQFVGPQLGFLNYISFIHGEEFFIPDHDLSADQHGLHVRGAGRIDQGCERVVDRPQVAGQGIDDGDVRQLAGTQAADAVRHAAGFGAFDGGHGEHVPGSQGHGIAGGDFLQQRRILHHLEHILGVVAGRTVAGQSDGDPGPAQFQYGGVAGRQDHV